MGNHGLHRAYVQAWVWVDLPIRSDTDAYTDNEFIAYAKFYYQVDGEIEFDDNAEISREDEFYCDCDSAK